MIGAPWEESTVHLSQSVLNQLGDSAKETRHVGVPADSPGAPSYIRIHWRRSQSRREAALPALPRGGYRDLTNSWALPHGQRWPAATLARARAAPLVGKVGADNPMTTSTSPAVK